MSENSENTTGANLDGDEPSMEDILASIRKIISDDEVSELNGVPSATESLSDRTFDLDNSEFSSDRDFDAPTIEEAKPFIALNTSKNNLSMEEFDSDELDDLLSFDDLEIPDIDSPNIDSSTESVPPIGALIDETESLTGNPEEASVLETLELIGQSEADVSTAPNLNDLDLSLDSLDGATDSEPLTLGELPMVTEKASVVDDLDSLLSKDLSVSEKGGAAEDITSDFDWAEVDFSLDDDLVSPEKNIDVVSQDVNSGDVSDLTTSGAETDIDLVKSLMADLTDDSFLGEDESLVEETPMTEAVDQEESEASEADVMDEILSMSMEDESELNVDESVEINVESGLTELDNGDITFEGIEHLLADQGEADAENDKNLSKVDVNNIKDDDLKVASTTSALQAIAMRAKESADEAELSKPRESIFSQVMDKSGIEEIKGQDENDDPLEGEAFESDDIEVVDDSVSESEDDIVEEENESADFESALVETDKQELLDANIVNKAKETPDMPKAIRSETILDDVTEKATIGAFAELNTIVEEKAIYEERGARIGDLVQEALRPMLKEWLDKNLQGIVERAVTKEVKRISTGK